MRKSFAAGDVAAVHWAELDVSGWPGSLRVAQQGFVAEPGVYHFMASLMVDGGGNMALVLARSSANEFPSVYYTGRFASDPPGTLRPLQLLKAGTSSGVFSFQAGRNRYGDFFGSASDPADGSLWMFGEYVRGSRDWGTQVGNVLFPP